MARRIKFKENWEMFMDPSFYDMWAVRPKNDKAFDSPRLFHFTHKEDAEKFIELINVSNHAILSDVNFKEIIKQQDND